MREVGGELEEEGRLGVKVQRGKEEVGEEEPG